MVVTNAKDCTMVVRNAEDSKIVADIEDYTMEIWNISNILQ